MRKLFVVLVFCGSILAFSQTTPVFVQSNSTGNANTSSTVAFSSNITAGNALYAVVYDNSAAGDTITFTDSESNTWTTTASANLSSGGKTIAVGCAVATTTGSDTITFFVNGTASAQQGALYEFSGATCNPDGNPVSLNTQSATSCNSGALTTTVRNDLLIGYCGTAEAFSSPTGGGTGWSHGLSTGTQGTDDDSSETQVATTAGSYSATSASIPTASEQTTIQVAYKAATGLSTWSHVQGTSIGSTTNVT